MSGWPYWKHAVWLVLASSAYGLAIPLVSPHMGVRFIGSLWASVGAFVFVAGHLLMLRLRGRGRWAALPAAWATYWLSFMAAMTTTLGPFDPVRGNWTDFIGGSSYGVVAFGFPGMLVATWLTLRFTRNTGASSD